MSNPDFALNHNKSKCFYHILGNKNLVEQTCYNMLTKKSRKSDIMIVSLDTFLSTNAFD